jgi:hypothetical protein
MSDIPNPENRTEEQPKPVEPSQPTSEPTVPQMPPNDPPAGDPPAGDPPADPIDYKEKFSQSTRENQILQAQLDEERRKNARRELTNEPAESELQAAFPEWEYMTDTEKRLARQSFTANKLAADLAREREEQREQNRWNTDLELAIAKETALRGREQAFKDFANKPTHRGAPTDVLVDAFLRRSPPPAPASAAPQPTLEPGNGGPRGPIESKKKYTAEEIMAIQTAEPKKYRQMLLAGEFDD